MRDLGTAEPYVEEDMSAVIGLRAVSVHWRKPLRVDEIAQLAPTPEVRSRPGRA